MQCTCKMPKLMLHTTQVHKSKKGSLWKMKHSTQKEDGHGEIQTLQDRQERRGSQATMFPSLPCVGDPHQQQRTRASSSAMLFGMNHQFNLSR